jgi:hypothetical protein
MEHFAALYSIVFMIGFVCVFDLRHIRNRRNRFLRMFLTAGLMTTNDLDQIRKIQLACNEA